MKNPFFEKRCRYSIRKLSVGACSLMIGSVLFANQALAEEVAIPTNETRTTAVAFRKFWCFRYIIKEEAPADEYRSDKSY